MEYNMNTKVLPNDVEAEKAVLGSMIFGKDAITISCEILKSEDFYRADHKIIFESMVELFGKNIHVDLVTLNNVLNDKGVLDAVKNNLYFINNILRM